LAPWVNSMQYNAQGFVCCKTALLYGDGLK
jgi:hypothetical protein